MPSSSVTVTHVPNVVPFATAVSGRYLIDQVGNPFLIKGDSLWDLAWKLNATDQATVLTDRQANGFNTVITDLSSNSATGMGTGNSNGANWNGEAPFTGTFTPNATFWARIDTFFQTALAHGITVFALPIDAYQTQSGQVFNAMTTGQASAFGAFLAARYPQSSYPNIVWMLGNDYNGSGVGSGGAIAFDSQYTSLVSGLTGAGDTRPVMCELGFWESRSSDSTAMKAITNLNACYSYHDVYEVILTGRAAWTAPALMIESAYENSGPDPSFSSNYYLRQQVAWTMTSGGAGEFYGNDSLWPFSGSWSTQLDTTAVAQIKALRHAIEQVAWWKLNPDTSSLLVTAGRGAQFTGGSAGTGPGVTTTYVTAAYSADGKIALVYNPDSTLHSLTLSASVLGVGPSITKVDPTNGATTLLLWTTTPSGGANAVGDHDWLYVITAS